MWHSCLASSCPSWGHVPHMARLSGIPGLRFSKGPGLPRLGSLGGIQMCSGALPGGQLCVRTQVAQLVLAGLGGWSPPPRLALPSLWVLRSFSLPPSEAEGTERFLQRQSRRRRGERGGELGGDYTLQRPKQMMLLPQPLCRRRGE